jgi:hypothetical protein
VMVISGSRDPRGGGGDGVGVHASNSLISKGYK